MYTNMAVPTLKFNFLFLIIFTGTLFHAHAVEEVVVIHAPESVKFVTSEPIRSSYLADIFSAMLCQTIKSNTEWNSLAAISPWKGPEAVAVIEILGFDSEIDLPLDGTKFLLENVGDMESQYHLPAYRIEERFFGKNPVMLHMALGEELYDSKIAEPILLKSLPADPKKRLKLAYNDKDLGELIKESIFNTSHPADVKLLTELITLKEFMKALSSHKSEIKDKIPDFYWFKISGLESIIDTYTPDSFLFREALRLLRQIVGEVERTLRSVYDDNVVITVIKTKNPTSPLGHKGRKLLEAAEAKELRISDYPAKSISGASLIEDMEKNQLIEAEKDKRKKNENSLLYSKGSETFTKKNACISPNLESEVSTKEDQSSEFEETAKLEPVVNIISVGINNFMLVPVSEKNYNLAARWDPMFPVIFIIFVFIGILLTLSVLGISLVLWNMDPGRDSIIYRMTSQRMKRD